MNMKALRAPLTLKTAGEPGDVTASFSTFDVVDSDGDIVLATALTHGQRAPMTNYGHNWASPVGKGQILVQPPYGLFDGAFFLDTDAGLETYKTVKNMAELQQWSWGFNILEAAPEQRDGRNIRVIKRAELFEVSPVLVGAGVGTYTLGIKSHLPYADQGEAVLAAAKDLIERSRSLADLRAKEGRVLSDANRKRLSRLLEALSAVQADITDLLAATEPAPKGVDVTHLFVKYQSICADMRRMGVG